MGRFLVILLVVLLPLRGWSAERMAIQMIEGQPVVEMAVGNAFTASMPADCPMMIQTGMQSEKSPSPIKSHTGCQTCQLCMALAAPNFASLRPLTYQRQVPAPSAGANFISADLARQVKPPIL